MSCAISEDDEEPIIVAGKLSDPGSGSFLLSGIDVIENGLPPLPDAVTYEMKLPISYWTAPKSAVVVFLRFGRHPADGGIQPVAMEVPYHRENGKWTVWASGSVGGSGFPFDPVAQPGFTADLDGKPIVYGSLSTIRAGDKPAAWVATGRASCSVAAIAVVQAGVEYRRMLDSHFGSWVVCAEAPEPFEVVAFDGSGQTLARLPHPFRRAGE
jgi:hypothetical protein